MPVRPIHWYVTILSRRTSPEGRRYFLNRWGETPEGFRTRAELRARLLELGLLYRYRYGRGPGVSMLVLSEEVDE